MLEKNPHAFILIIDEMRRAAENKADILLIPECFITGLMELYTMRKPGEAYSFLENNGV